MDNDIYDKINNLYTKGGFFSKYAFHLWSSLILIFIVFLIVSYYYVMNHLQPIKNDWANQRCNPAIIPFAGMIVKPNDKTIMQATEENFAHCTQTILKNITDYAFVPIYYIANTITQTFNEAVNAVNSLRGILDKMRDSINSITSNVMGRALNITLPLIKMVIYMRHVIGKTQATLTASVFTFLGGYLTLNSFFVFVYDLIIDVMYVIVSFIVACFAVGWLFPPTLAVGLAAAAFLTVLLVPVIILQIFMADIFKVRGKSPPGIPTYHCFDKNTKLKLKNKEKKFISEIQPGEELYDGSVVTSVIKSNAHGQDFYKLNNIIVTGKHKVYHHTLGWIYVDKHPDSIYIDNYNEPYVYCLNTTNKLIQINNTIFSDWDEFNNNVTDTLYKNCPDVSPYKLNDIYKNVEAGLHPDTEVMLEDGRCVSIKDVEVNDILLFGEKVTSIVKTYTENCKEYYQININDFVIKCSRNISIYNNSLGNKYNIAKQTIEPPCVSYHIITNTGNIKLNGIIIDDFNSGLDKFLN